jgi:hypothetical protein
MVLTDRANRSSGESSGHHTNSNPVGYLADDMN